MSFVLVAAFALWQAPSAAPAAPGVESPSVDPRAAYDVQAYRLDLRVDPETRTLSGVVAMDALVTTSALDTLVLDLKSGLDVSAVRALAAPFGSTTALEGTEIAFTHAEDRLVCKLGALRRAGESVRIAVAYSGHPKARDSFAGFHWTKTKDGSPWICTSCQDEGSASWWPGKDSFFHPEDKPQRIFENYTVPKGLYAVGNGRLAGRDVNADSTETFHWIHEYPLETYSVTLDVAPYVVVERKIAVEGVEGELPFVYYVLPEDAEKAALQFEDVPNMIAAYSGAFGPFPFPKSKYALVETNFWGMEHSTAVAYGSSFPAWLAKNGGKDRYASRNALFDYILVHESAHEWWGNGVSAKAWGDFWIHEGFATYAEAVYLEHVKSAELAQKHMQGWKSQIGRKSRLYRGKDVNSDQAYDITIYSKGAWVLHTLRHYVDDDAAWWKSLRAFNLEFRYKNADSQDFRAVLERETKRDWKTFFDEWVYGAGYPKLSGSVRATAAGIEIDVANEGTSTDRFHVPLDLVWREGETPMKRRCMLEPGANKLTISCAAKPADLKLVGLDHVLCDADIRVE
jgi:aminopeptidase N